MVNVNVKPSQSTAGNPGSSRQRYYARLAAATHASRQRWKAVRIELHLAGQAKHVEKKRVTMDQRVCAACDQSYQLPEKWAHRDYCIDCGIDAFYAQTDAASQVSKAIRLGRLMRADQFRCVDCDAWADRYDHRDYHKPLAVDPVCARCNSIRPPAYRKISPSEAENGRRITY